MILVIQLCAAICYYERVAIPEISLIHCNAMSAIMAQNYIAARGLSEYDIRKTYCIQPGEAEL